MGLSPVLEAAIQEDLPTEDLIALLREHESHTVGKYYRELSNTNLSRRRDGTPQHREPEFWESWVPLKRSFQFGFYHKLPVLKALDDGMLLQTMDSRRASRNQFIRWLCDPLRNGNLLLVFNHYQTFPGDEPVFLSCLKHICQKLNRLGAVVYSGDFVLPNLCAQLCIRCPPYRRALTEVFIDSSTIFSQGGLCHLLRKLIFEPFKKLRISHPDYFAKPMTIFIDSKGSEWKNMDFKSLVAQLRSITEDQRSNSHPCLLWVVTCAWDPSISTFLSRDPQRSQQIRLVDSNDARHYSESILRLRFQEIRARHNKLFGENEEWPLKDDLERLARAVSGADPLIDLVTRFVDLAGKDGPPVRLQKSLAYLSNAPALTIQSPYDAPAHFVNQFINDTPVRLYPHVLHMLSCLGYFSIDAPTLPRLTHLLGIDPAPSSRVIAHLDWIIYDQGVLDTYSQEPYYYLLGAVRQFGKIRFSPTEIQAFTTAVIKRYLRFFSKSPLMSTKPRHHPPDDDPRAAAMRSIGHLYNDFSVFLRICDSAAKMNQGKTAVALLRNFDFRRLAFLHTDEYTCSNLLQLSVRLHQSADGRGIVRTTASNISDSLLIGHCKGIAEPLDFSSIDPEKIPDYCSFDSGMGPPKCPRFVLLGHGRKTVLVIFFYPHLYTTWGDISIFTLGMLVDF
ncbi:hypothetical protein NP233_g157 [Leucocoprinus birnbaumii]|uniref:Uncharacterized protein n=1 Tax=Leucocoprinus birnbaumii TaxID=56174 RepID=A0AAD5W4L3_9AGAR|nr:hypothetical protein NP233_g157 [Leucocoprinus birnbaumii]